MTLFRSLTKSTLIRLPHRLIGLTGQNLHAPSTQRASVATASLVKKMEAVQKPTLHSAIDWWPSEINVLAAAPREMTATNYIPKCVPHPWQSVNVSSILAPCIMLKVLKDTLPRQKIQNQVKTILRLSTSNRTWINLQNVTPYRIPIQHQILKTKSPRFF